jgi:hypothetical protein
LLFSSSVKRTEIGVPGRKHPPQINGAWSGLFNIQGQGKSAVASMRELIEVSAFNGSKSVSWH